MLTYPNLPNTFSSYQKMMEFLNILDPNTPKNPNSMQKAV